MRTKELFKTDKNGTKYYDVTAPCAKCNGTGYVAYFKYYQQGVCFDCGGSGVLSWVDKEYTPEYEAKLNARREKLAAKKLEEARAKSAERNSAFFTKHGWSADGEVFVILGDTYSIKEQLKEEGARYDARLGWYFASAPTNHPYVSFKAEEILNQDCAYCYGPYFDYKDEAQDFIAKRIKDNTPTPAATESANNYVGTIGDKLDTIVAYKGTLTFEVESRWGSIFYIHKFEDADGNSLVWKTSTSVTDIERGKLVHLKATIKDHTEYKDHKQTELTRCRVENIEEEAS